MKESKHSQLAFAIFDKFGIVPRSRGMAIFEEKHNAEYEKQFYSSLGKSEVKSVLITVVDNDWLEQLKIRHPASWISSIQSKNRQNSKGVCNG